MMKLHTLVLATGAVSVLSAPGQAQLTDPVIWDNGDCTSSYPFHGALSQLDVDDPFEAEAADDFTLAEDYLLTDVHWQGGYYYADPVPGETTDFRISIYADDGAFSPGSLLHRSIVSGGGSNEPPEPEEGALYDYWGYVDPYPLEANVIYWISIQALLNAPPMWAWAFVDEVPGQLDEAYWRSAFFGYPDWTPMTNAYGEPYDMSFKLTGVPAPTSWLLLGMAGLITQRRR
ncbi:MAG: hypothetical protein ACF8NJ_04465 [Phycisphaerales bacterium JB038]